MLYNCWKHATNAFKSLHKPLISRYTRQHIFFYHYRASYYWLCLMNSMVLWPNGLNDLFPTMWSGFESQHSQFVWWFRHVIGLRRWFHRMAPLAWTKWNWIHIAIWELSISIHASSWSRIWACWYCSVCWSWQIVFSLQETVANVSSA